jgi:hypothetical protein
MEVIKKEVVSSFNEQVGAVKKLKRKNPDSTIKFMHLSVLYINQKEEKSGRNHSNLDFHQSMKNSRTYFHLNIS